MAYYSVTRQALSDVLNDVASRSELIAPVKSDLVRFEVVKDESQRLCLDEQAFFPAKEFFFPQSEELFTFEDGKFKSTLPPQRKRVFFGLRLCDLNAVARQDKALASDPTDPYYANRRSGALLLGLHCAKAMNEYCFCGSMGLHEGGDAMFYPRGNGFLVETLTPQGEAFVKTHREFKPTHASLSPKEKGAPQGTDRLHKKDLRLRFDRKEWQSGVDACLSCGACTALCPTCYCFEVRDERSLANPEKGKRVRAWSSCQLEDFTRISGGYVFRSSRSDRFKHRIYHQLEYFREKNGVDLCVGCGRCITGCPTRIDFVKIINSMA